MQRYIVDVKGWTHGGGFVHLFAVAQAAPGPNVLFTSLIGYRWRHRPARLLRSSGCACCGGADMGRLPLWERVR